MAKKKQKSTPILNVLKKTFTSKDVLRIFENHLDRQEQTEVLIAICRDIKIEVFDGIAQLVPELASKEAIEEQDIIDLIVDLIAARILF